MKRGGKEDRSRELAIPVSASMAHHLKVCSLMQHSGSAGSTALGGRLCAKTSGFAGRCTDRCAGSRRRVFGPHTAGAAGVPCPRRPQEKEEREAAEKAELKRLVLEAEKRELQEQQQAAAQHLLGAGRGHPHHRGRGGGRGGGGYYSRGGGRGGGHHAGFF